MEDCAVALVTDNIVLLPSYTPFERPPDNTTLYSLIPRGVRRFFFNAATAAKPINDGYNMSAVATLPANFAYIFTKFNLQLSVDRVSDFDTTFNLKLLNHIPGQSIGVSENVMASGTVIAFGGTDPQYSAQTVDLSDFTAPFWAVTPNSAVTFILTMRNSAAAAAAAGFLICHVEFLEYDLTQAQRYWLNTPVPVLTR